jgi:hypothetical protein
MSYYGIECKCMSESTIHLCMNYKKDLSLAFGDYAEVYNGTDDMACSHSVPCIALYQCNNMTGSWKFLNLSTK